MLIKGLIFCVMLTIGLFVVRMGKGDKSTECSENKPLVRGN